MSLYTIACILDEVSTYAGWLNAVGLTNQKGKQVEYLWGAILEEPSLIGDQIFHAPAAKPWHYATKIRTLSIHSVAQLLLTPRFICLRCVPS